MKSSVCSFFTNNAWDLSVESWLATPGKQSLIILNRKIEIEPSSGEKRTFRRSDIILLEKPNDKGHYTRHI